MGQRQGHRQTGSGHVHHMRRATVLGKVVTLATVLTLLLLNVSLLPLIPSTSPVHFQPNWFSSEAWAMTVCDVDDDGDVDRLDVNQVFAARGQAANPNPGDPRDANSDGLITVADGRACALQCTVAGCAIIVTPPTNTAPVAEAGPAQSVFVGNMVTLDGSGSSDADSDPLTFAWQIISEPAGSAASLSDATAVMPTFFANVPGTYEIQLIVNDSTVNSLPDTVIITTDNSPPVAEAGPGQSPQVNDTVTLDGSGSSDVDGDQLTFAWSLTVPTGSSATLSDPTAVMPSFVVDLPGTYIAQLIVNDGTVNSLPDTVMITTDNSPPVAEAGPGQSPLVNDTVTLDGSGSSDADNDLLTFAWSLTVPLGSSATLSDPTAVMPTFVVDLPGTYVAQLVVNDGTVDSAPDTVMITTDNSPPVANAGPAQPGAVGMLVQLDGSGSSDADNDLLTFAWSFTMVPAGSTITTADLSNSTIVNPTFVPDVGGTYIAQLIVNDGTVNSLPDTVTITVSNQPTAVDDTATVNEDSLTTTINVLNNDLDLASATIAAVTQPTNGVIVITNGGADLTYQPNADFCNDGSPTDNFTYTLTSGGATGTATVRVTVNCVDDPPVAVNDTATVSEGAPATTINVLLNDTDSDGGPISIASVTQPANGTVVITNGGADLTYQPNASFCNDGSPTDNFTYSLAPGGSVATVRVTVTCAAPQGLVAGDIAIIGIHNDTTNEFSWVPLVDISAGTVIYFSDAGFQSGVGFRAATRTEEALIRFITPAGGIAAGTVQTVIDSSSPANYDGPGTTTQFGADILGTTLDFSRTGLGDELIVFLSTDDPTASTFGQNNFTPLFQVDPGSFNRPLFQFFEAALTHTTDLHPGLTLGTSAVGLRNEAIPDEFDSIRYTGTTTGTRASLLAAIGNSANWEGTDASQAAGWTNNSGGNFTVNP